MKKTLFLVAVFALLAIVSCNKNSTPEPAPQQQPVTRIAAVIHKNNNIPQGMTLASTYRWENGKLVGECDSIVIPMTTTVYYNDYTCENGNVVKITEETGLWEYTFTYEDGRLTEFLNKMGNDTASWGKVISYTNDNQVETIMSYNEFMTTKWTLVWENGDAIEVKEEIIAPAFMVSTYVDRYTYDDKTNAYTGTPLAYSIIDGNGNKVALRMSKHNQIEEGVNYEYNADGFLVSAVKPNDSTFYTYMEQVLR